jgi:hypothetical protein
MASRAQFEQIRRALPQGMVPPQAGPDEQGGQQPPAPGDSGGMYL